MFGVGPSETTMEAPSASTPVTMRRVGKFMSAPASRGERKGWKDLGRARAETDGDEALAFRAAGDDQLVAVLQPDPGLAAGQGHRGPSAGDFGEAGGAFEVASGKGAGGQQVARLQVAAADGVVGQH